MEKEKVNPPELSFELDIPSDATLKDSGLEIGFEKTVGGKRISIKKIAVIIFVGLLLCLLLGLIVKNLGTKDEESYADGNVFVEETEDVAGNSNQNSGSSLFEEPLNEASPESDNPNLNGYVSEGHPVGGSDEESGEDADEVRVIDSPSVTDTIEYVTYQNGLLGLQVSYPSNWYYTELTDSFLSKMNKLLANGQSFSLDHTDLNFDLPVVEFRSPDKESVVMTLYIIPKNDTNVLSQGKKKEVTLAGRSGYLLESEIDDFGLKKKWLQYVVPYNKTRVVLDLVLYPDTEIDYGKVVNHIFDTLTFS